MQFRLGGDFNTVGKTYSVLGSDVYFIKYDQAASVDAKWSSEHFTTFLSHEAFHYYMQDNWPEGTAIYAGIQVSRRVGYDFGVMYFSNRKDVPFSEIIPQYRAGNIDKSYLADRIPYDTGGLLCLLMDELEVPGWQETLNGQTLDAPVSLYSILKEWVEG